MSELRLAASEIEDHLGEHVTDHHRMVEATPVPMAHSFDWSVVIFTIDDMDALEFAAASLGLEITSMGAKTDAFNDEWAGIVINCKEVDNK